MKAIIYKLYNPDYPEFYIGSTIDFQHRKQNHRRDCCRINTRYYHLKVYKYIRTHGGWDSWKFDIIEEGEYDNETAILRREGHFMKSMKATLNSHVPGRTTGEYYQDKKEQILKKHKEYRKNNKERNKITQKEWKKNNQDKVKASNEKSRLKHKDKYKTKYNEQRAEKIECEFCKSIVRRGDLARHQKTMKCITLQLFNF